MARDAKVQIQFEPKGHEELIEALNRVNKETRKLSGGAKRVVQPLNKYSAAATKGAFAVRNLRNSTSSLGIAFSTLRSKILVGSFALGMITKLTVDNVKAFEEQESTLRRINFILKQTQKFTGVTSTQIKVLSEQLSKTTIHGDEHILMLSSMLATYNQINKDIFPETLKLALDVSAALGTDTKSALTMVAKAVQDPIRGLTALSRAGVTFDSVTQKQIKSLMKFGRVAEAQRIILDGIASNVKGASESFTEAFTAIHHLTNAWGDFKEALGEKLSPYITEWLKKLTTVFTGDRFDPIQDSINEVKLRLLDLAETENATELQKEMYIGILEDELNAYEGVQKATLSQINSAEDLTFATTRLYNEEKRRQELYDNELAFHLELDRAVSKALKNLEKENLLVSQFTAMENVEGFKQVTNQIKELAGLKDPFGAGLEPSLKNIMKIAGHEMWQAMAVGLMDVNEAVGKAGLGVINFSDTFGHSVADMEDAIAAKQLQYAFDAFGLSFEGYLKLFEDNPINEFFDDLIGLDTIDLAEYDRLLGIFDDMVAKIEEYENAGNILVKVQNKQMTVADAQAYIQKKLYIQLEEDMISQEKYNFLLNEWGIILEYIQKGYVKTLTQLEKNIEKMKIWLPLIGQAVNAYTAMGFAQIEANRSSELAAAEAIHIEEVKQAKIEAINKKYDAKRKAAGKEKKRLDMAMTTANTAVAIMQTWADGELGTTAKVIMAALIGATGAMQLATIDAQQYQYGGLVGGRRHSQGGTLIEAEEGEFVMNRDAVNAVGIERMNRINRGDSSSVSISFSGNVLSSDFIEREAIPKIKQAIRRGADIGIG